MNVVAHVIGVDGLGDSTPASDDLMRANVFIKKLIQQHYAAVADQCAALTSQPGSEPHTRHAMAKVLGQLQVMREIGDHYQRKVITRKGLVTGLDAIKACMGFWIEDLQSLLTISPTAKPHELLGALPAEMAKDQEEEHTIMNAQLLSIYGEMLESSRGWLATQVG